MRYILQMHFALLRQSQGAGDEIVGSCINHGLGFVTIYGHRYVKVVGAY